MTLPASTIDRAAPTANCVASIIVPTYREAKNLPHLVPRIAAALSSAGVSHEIVIVDDNSRDGTEAVCAALAEDYSVRLLVRAHERGLSSAVLHGMQQARGDVFVVMDADLSHPPEKIPELLAAVQSDADFAIGSRYVRGGSVVGGWGLFRWLNSKVATLLAWPLTASCDPMAGFFALRRATFQAAHGLDPIGYKIGLELIVKGHCRKIKEVPIQFGNRLHGESKLTLQEQLNYLRHLKRLYEYRLGKLAQPLQFALVGATGAMVDLLTLSLLLPLLPASLARALAIGTAMTWNFWLNRSFTFATSRNKPLLHQFLAFCLSCLLGAGISWSIFAALHQNVPLFATWPLAGALIGIVGGTTVNYGLCKFVAFK
jgi:dolichol-phosphate mannosyltransferase